MRRLVILLALFPAMLLAKAPTDAELTSAQRGLLDDHRKAEQDYARVSPKKDRPLSILENLVPSYEQIQKTSQSLEKPFIHPQSSPGASLLWTPSAREVPQSVATASSFQCGPESCVVPFSGEFVQNVTDLSLPSRGGIGFTFTRAYFSFAKEDTGLGKGWGSNWDLCIREEGEGENAVRILRRFGREVRFSRKGDAWEPEPGEFLRMEALPNDSLRIILPDLMRFDFELAADQPALGRRWRIVAVASRHDDGKANRMTVAYEDGCDRIRSVTDPFGQVVRFAYDPAGHLVQVTAPQDAVRFAYGDNGVLVRAEYPDVMRSVRTREKRSVDYAYDAAGRMTRRTSTNVPYALETVYDAAGRASACGFVGAKLSQTWTFEYAPGETTMKGPAPTPATCFRFGETPHPSLPSEVSIPARGAVTRYVYSPDYLIAEETDEIGCKTVYVYDAGNANPAFRGNLLAQRRTPAPNAPADRKEIGTESVYDPSIALVVENVTYQITTDGVREDLKKETFEYDDADHTLRIHDDAGIRTRTWCNRYGEPVLELDALGVCTLYRYADALSFDRSYEFANGTVTGGGYLVERIDDASAAQFSKACAELGIREPARGTAVRAKAAERSTRYAYDVHGNLLRECSGYSDSLYFTSADGVVIAESHSDSGTTVRELLPSGKPKRVYTEFEPDATAAYQGVPEPAFAGKKFVEETYSYDDLLMLARHDLSQESYRDGRPNERYERLPNGRVRKFWNASGLCREDDIDPATGYLREQRMLDEKAGRSIVLATDFQYFPNGEIRSSVDVFGGKTETVLDGFGNVRTSILANGRHDTRIVDALGRVREEYSEWNGKRESRTVYTYGPYGLLAKTEKARITPVGEILETVAEYRYDASGNRIAERGAHEDSWAVVLYDGLGNEIGRKAPSGDTTVIVYRDDAEVYSSVTVKGKVNGVKSLGTLSEHDAAGRIIRRTPVDARGRKAEHRYEACHYDAVGRKVFNETDLLRTETVYDSLGRVIRETVEPKAKDQGERTVVSATEYLADGRVSEKSVGNTALAVLGAKQKAEVRLTDAPQTTKTQYDGFGRVVLSEQPDGLRVATEYNDHSLPVHMVWTHGTDPNVALRELSFAYSDMGQVLSVANAKDNAVLREYEYDAFGRCVRSIDYGAEDPVVTAKSFDSLGRVLEETIAQGKHTFPSQKYEYDAAKGKMNRTWAGDVVLKRPYWEREAYEFDASGRQVSIGLWGDTFAQWEYIGNNVESRRIQESGITALSEYNELGELVKQRFRRGAADVGCLEYAYGDQGQPEYASTRLKDSTGKDYAYAVYSGFDSFRRLTAQNGETALRDTPKARADRREKVFGKVAQSLHSVNTLRMAYDETDNLWLRYSGELSSDFKVDSFKPEQTPRFTSAAPILNSVDLQSAKWALAANRETTVATYAEASGGERLTAQSDSYDRLGNLVRFGGTFWNGQRKYPVDWALEYDALGRLARMEAKATETQGRVRKNEVVAELRFIYDAENRRLGKTVVDRTFVGTDDPVTNTTYTVYSGNEQRLVLESKDGKDSIVEAYLWGVGSRELLMGVMPENVAQKGGAVRARRYYFQQDRNLNVVLVTCKDDLTGGMKTVSAASYLGFGENATQARISNIDHSANLSPEHDNAATDQTLDGMAARWYPNGNDAQYLMLNLENEASLAQLNIWTKESFPETFCVYVLPKDEMGPGAAEDAWFTQHSECLVGFVQNRIYQKQIKRDDWSDPYRLNLQGVKGNRILLAWDAKDAPRTRKLEVHEFEVVKIPDNPGAIAFAGQWLDRETDLYYQINRYRKAGSEKFISPDPLGFLDGPNMYAYAHANPLEWHDPDGRFAWATVGIGAAIGALFGGGGYALQCWLSGKEFSWKEFAIQTLIGAVSGAVSALTMGLFNPWAGQAVATTIGQSVFRGAVRGAVSGLVAGSVAGGLDPAIHGIDNNESLKTIARKTFRGVVKGTVAGAVVGGIVGGFSAGYAQWNMMRPENECVYRVCRVEENPRNGLSPKDVTATKTVASHVGSGSRPGYKSQFISTTKSYETAAKWAVKNPGSRIVKINTSKINNPMYDLTDSAVQDKLLTSRFQKCFAKGSQEVIIEGKIPADAITSSEFLGFEF